MPHIFFDGDAWTFLHLLLLYWAYVFRGLLYLRHLLLVHVPGLEYFRKLRLGFYILLRLFLHTETVLYEHSFFHVPPQNIHQLLILPQLTDRPDGLKHILSDSSHQQVLDEPTQSIPVEGGTLFLCVTVQGRDVELELD